MAAPTPPTADREAPDAGASRPRGRAVTVAAAVAVVLVAVLGVGMLGDLGGADDVLDVPPPGQARTATLADGTPVLVTRTEEDDAVHVLDARLPYADADDATTPSGDEAQVVGLLGWCDAGSRGPTVVEPLGVRSWDAAGLPQVGAFGAAPEGPQAHRPLAGFAHERAGDGPVRVGERETPPREVEPVQLPWPSGCPPEETATPPLSGERVSPAAPEELATLPEGRYRLEAVVEQVGDATRWCPVSEEVAAAAERRGDGEDVDWPMPLCEDGAPLRAAHSWDGVASDGDAVARVGTVGAVVGEEGLERLEVPADAQLAFGPVAGEVRLEGRLLSRAAGEAQEGSWRSITPGEEPAGTADAALTGVRVRDWGDARGEPQAMPRGRGIKVQLWLSDDVDVAVPDLRDPEGDPVEDAQGLLAALEGRSLREAPTVEAWVDRVTGEVTRLASEGPGPAAAEDDAP